jgi:cytochrome P450
MSLRQFLRVVRENILATYAPEDFDKDFIARWLLWRRTFVVNEPTGVRHVLLDNAQNYKKSELSRRILEPGLGRGLITTDGELWRRHRRIMAPAFDPRSVAGYAPVMTEVTEEMLAQWAALPERSEVDVAVAMMHTTLHIISRAMFSSDSDEIVDVVERGVSEYQTTVRPNLLDLLHVPEWLTELISPRMADGILDEFDASVDRLLTERGRAPDAEPKDLLARLVAARHRDRRRHDRAGSARPGCHHLHGRTRDDRADAGLDLVSAVATSGRGSEAPRGTGDGARRAHTAPRGRRQPPLRAHGARGGDAALSAGAHSRAPADRG